MRVLIVGSGFLGMAIARQAVADGNTVVLCSRTPPRFFDAGGVALIPVDATRRADCARAMAQARPDAIVLVHGPSDVTWCENHPELAEAAHATASANIAACAAGARIVLVSTDNVFSGTAAFNGEQDTPAPVNAYGRAKLSAERTLADTGVDAVVLRVSLVYDWEAEDAGKWLNYFSACAHRLRRGEAVKVPGGDHWTTPVLLDDMARVVSAVLTGDLPGVLHLGGPDRISRARWARLIAEALGADPALVVPVPSGQSRYACRPVNSCLASSYLGVLPATRNIQVRGVGDGIRALLARDAGPVPWRAFVKE